MKHNWIENNSTHYLSVAIMSIIFLLCGCGGEDSTSDSSSDTGSVSFRVVWNDPPKSGDDQQAKATQADPCVDYGVTDVNAKLTNSSGGEITKDSWKCTAHGGTFKDVPTGSGMTLTLIGIVDGNEAWRGEKSSITVKEGANNVGEIEMDIYIGDDTNPPYVNEDHDPAADATDVSLDTTITATFSEKVVEASVNTTSCTLKEAVTSNPITCTVSYEASTRTVTMTPDGSLSESTDYTVTITTDVEDLAGNNMASPETWTFTTIGPIDTDPPYVTDHSPVAEATGVSLDPTITATFNEKVVEASVNTTSCTLKEAVTSTPITCTVSYEASTQTVTMTPDGSLSESTDYIVTITTDVEDLAGNKMASQETWTFTTTGPIDTNPPYVTTHNPASDATGVSLDPTITATFNEKVVEASVNTTSCTLKEAVTSTPITCTVSYEASSRTVTISPNASLSTNTAYTVTITTTVEDLAGNNMASQETWTFTTTGPTTLIWGSGNWDEKVWN